MLKEIGPNIWTMDGPNIVFGGASMHTRMTIIRLSSGELWVHSPIERSTATDSAISSLGGTVTALVAPNKFHYMYLSDWAATYPQAKIYAEAMLRKKVDSLKDSDELTNTSPSSYAKDIEQLVLDGNRLFQEVIFFHTESQTLILTDLMINLRPEGIRTLPKLFLRFEGALFPNGGIPRLYRWFTRDKHKARESLRQIKSWAPKRLTFSHGEPFQQPADKVIEQQFAWLED